VGVRGVVVHSCNRPALLTKIWNRNLKFYLSSSYSFRDVSVHMDEFLMFVGVRVGMATVFMSIDRY